MVGTIAGRLKSKEFQACVWVLTAGAGVGAVATLLSSPPFVILVAAGVGALLAAFPASAWLAGERAARDG